MKIIIITGLFLHQLQQTNTTFSVYLDSYAYIILSLQHFNCDGIFLLF